MSKPRVLVLGGCGFVGRNLVSYLAKNDLTSAIRVVDKVPPQVAWLNDAHTGAFGSSNVEFKSANLINPESCKNVFQPFDGMPWDIVVNCAGETKLGQTDPVYNEGILKLSLNCAKEAAQQNVKHFIELSSGNMYSSDKVAHKEDGPVEPWTFVAKWKRQVEKQFAEMSDLPYTILRLPVVYGPGDRSGLMPRIMAAAIYKHLGETMKLLWNAELRINTVHVNDVCGAIWFVCCRDDTVGQIYNVVDDADSTQGSITNILADLFNVKVDYYGNLVSAVVDLVGAADDANDKHLGPWAEACRDNDILNTPLSPHMDSELLLHKHLRLDGSKLRNLGFSVSVPHPTEENLKEIVNDFLKMKVFPQSLAP
ncbi:dTDP-D-glucose 4,6-dehydratase [Anoplophora glabripennis]|uniref:dTDP-D-glucose 4,6-dehydratase n=1 Tax=Anoplophora glabripennis TaxID=217634 RepID=V5GVS9_ANOGL|nr:dTDP-D-glucose 4,6-dehydratase [Anoplophora glabripennis]